LPFALKRAGRDQQQKTKNRFLHKKRNLWMSRAMSDKVVELGPFELPD
jgi:hypothetical protein